MATLKIDASKYSHKQQITFVTCCQEAANRVLTGRFGSFFERDLTISNPLIQEHIVRTLRDLSSLPLSGIVDKIQFNRGDTVFTEEAINAIKAEQQRFIEKASHAEGIEVPDEELKLKTQKKIVSVAPSECIPIFDELVPCLATLPTTRAGVEEREAHAHLLKLKCFILAKTAADAWQVTMQLFFMWRGINFR